MRNWWPRFEISICLVVFVAIIVFSTEAFADQFDWRNINGNDFTSPVRSQSSCGSCWAFAAVAALEARFNIVENDADLDYDLSEQHLICTGGLGDCSGGWEFRALDFFVSDGITDEATLPYEASNTSPNWPLSGSYWNYQTDNIYNWIDLDEQATETDTVKLYLETYGPLVAAINTSDWYSPTGISMTDPLGLVNHAITVVGYMDDLSISSGGYWIIKNSWGVGWNDNGYGYIKYGDIEKHDRIHAITGNVSRVLLGADSVIPEPATFVLFGVAAVCGLVRRRRKAA